MSPLGVALLTFAVALAIWQIRVRGGTDPHRAGHYTERREEWIIRDSFQERRGGVFVDAGANHYQRFSKTYRLEVDLANLYFAALRKTTD